MDVVLDTSVVIDVLNGRPAPAYRRAMDAGLLVIPPLVVAELVTGAELPDQRETIGILLQDFPVHSTPLSHWIDVGNLRRLLRLNGIWVSMPDAHVAQCALDRDAVLLSRDAVFERIGKYYPLRLEKP